MMVREEDITSVGEIFKIKFGNNGEIKDPKSKIEYFGRYIVSSMMGDISTSSLIDLASSGDLQKYVYTSNVLKNTIFYDDESKIAEYLVGIAAKTAEEYLNNPYDIIPKVDYYKNNEIMRDIYNIVTLTKALDRKSVLLFFNLLDSKKILPSDYFDLLVYLSRNNYHRAYGYLGEIYFYGLGVPKSTDKAMEMYLKGKIGSDVISYNGIGRILMGPEYEDYNSAKNHFEMASLAGMLHESDYRLFELHTYHLLMPEYGRFYLSKSLNMGFLPALYKDGLNYFLKKDFASACIRLEPLLDYTRPVNDLQILASKFLKEKKYYNSLISHLMAAELGSKSSLNNAIYLLENVQLLEKQYLLLFNLYIRQMRGGVNTNLNRIGDCYFYGLGVSQSYSDAFSFYLSSSVLKDIEGIVNVAYMYEKGLGVERSLMKSFQYIRTIRTGKSSQMKLDKTREGAGIVPKVSTGGKVSGDHEESSSTTNNVIIKISENKKKKTGKKKSEKDLKNKKERPIEKKPVSLTPPTVPVPDSTYQVPTSNVLFKDLEPKKIQILEKDYQELLESNKMMSKSMSEFHKYLNKSNGIISKLQSQNTPKDDTKPRDLFNIKVIEVSDDVKSTK